MNILKEIKTKCEFVANDNSHVKICYENIPAYVKNIIIPEVKKSSWNWDWHYKGENDEDTLSYLIALDAINFGSGYFSQLRKKDGINSGYASIAIYLKEEFIKHPLTAKDFANITTDTCLKIFQQDKNNPIIIDLMQKFATALNELGEFVIKNYDGSFQKLVISANNSAVELVNIFSKLKFFHDIAVYKGENIPIYKRAQILVGDIYTAFAGKRLGYFKDIDELTIFADNVVPHVLRYDNILQYSEELAKIVDSGTELSPDDEKEIALRTCSIHAVEEILKELKKQNKTSDIITIYIDHWLWDRGHKEPYISKKRHITKTIYY